MSDFIHIPATGVKAHRYIRKSDIDQLQLNYGAEDEKLYIFMKDGTDIEIPAKNGVTMADLDAIVMDITGQ
jgi:hypothetical protein